MGMIPEDTSRRDPGKYITDMEAAGQRQLVASSVLPRDRGDDAPYLALGFVFGAVVDDLFQEATLPLGWSKQGSDHAMGSYVVDERGIKRVSIFYKAFYDRSASMYLMHPGSDAALGAIYGEPDPVAGPWAVLTAEERADAVSWAEDYLQSATEYPDIYGSRASRAREVLEQLAALEGDVR